ncbi:FMN reductase [Terrihabitans soli]|uniref:FMN reductase n=1 Tax=Terrihabitans soli TaxID=708113 RepID=A0A6S6QVA5_9HYPH|nr:FMN reductase [Terrihabitans soli]
MRRVISGIQENKVSKPQIVGISGNLASPSRTLSLVVSTAERIARESGGEARVLDISDLWGLGEIRSRAGAPPAVEAALKAVEQADLLVVGSPVYKGSYTGLFKHFIDFIDYRSLIGTPVALLATGGSDRHALVIEHQLRPLFGFFQAQVLGTGIFLTEKDFSDGEITDAVLKARFDQLVREGVDALRPFRSGARTEAAA